MGAALGRLMGEALLAADLASERDLGTWALLGAAAVLTGMTRMMMTVAIILVEVAKDAHALPALMIAVAGARLVGDLICHGFDHGMIELENPSTSLP